MLLPQSCCCDSACSIFSDTFTRAEPGGDYDTHGFISISGSGDPEGAGILEMLPSVSPGGYAYVAWHGPAPTHFSASYDIWIPSAGDKAGIAWQVVGAGGSGAGKRYYVEIVTSDQDQFLSADHSHCGTLSIYDISTLGTYTLIGRTISIPGLTCGSDLTKPAFHRLTFCFDYDTKLLSCHVKTKDGNTYAHHAKDVPVPGLPLTDSQIWAFSRDSTLALFDNFDVSETKARDCCPCNADELQESDDFVRGTDPEFIDYPGVDSTTKWSSGFPGTAANGIWQITQASSTPRLEYIPLGPGPGGPLGSIVFSPAGGSTFPVPYSISVKGNCRDSNEWLIVAIVGGNSYAASLTAGAAGVLAIKSGTTGLTYPSTTVASKHISNVPFVTGNPVINFNTMTLCYDGRCLTASVVLADGRSPKPLRVDVGHFTGALEVFLMCKPSAVNKRFNFRDMSVSTAVEVAGDTDPYAPLVCDNGCPCCGPTDCQTVTLTFLDDDDGEGSVDEDTETDTDPIDCRLETTGEIVREDDVLHMPDGSQIAWLGGWSGITKDCLPDNTTSVAVIVKSSTYGAKFRVGIGEEYAELTLQSSAEADDGTLAISGAEPIDVSGLNIDTDIGLCLSDYGHFLYARTGAYETSTDRAGGDSGKPFAKAEFGDWQLESFSVAHNLPQSGCDPCLTGGGEVPFIGDCNLDSEATPCQPGFPLHALLSITPAGGSCAGCASWFDGSFLAEGVMTEVEETPGNNVCIVTYDTGPIFFDVTEDSCDCTEPASTDSDANECKFIAFRLVVVVTYGTDGTVGGVSGFVASYKAIPTSAGWLCETAAEESDFALDDCGGASFGDSLASTYWPLEAPGSCEGIELELPYVAASGDSLNCFFTDQVLRAVFI